MLLYLIFILNFSQENISDIENKLNKAKADFEAFEKMFDSNPAYKKQYLKTKAEVQKNPRKYINQIIEAKKQDFKEAKTKKEKDLIKKEIENLVSLVKMSNILDNKNTIKNSDIKSNLPTKTRFNPKKEQFDPLMDNDIFALISSSYKNRADAGILKTD